MDDVAIDIGGLSLEEARQKAAAYHSALHDAVDRARRRYERAQRELDAAEAALDLAKLRLRRAEEAS